MKFINKVKPIVIRKKSKTHLKKSRVSIPIISFRTTSFICHILYIIELTANKILKKYAAPHFSDRKLKLKITF